MLNFDDEGDEKEMARNEEMLAAMDPSKAVKEKLAKVMDTKIPKKSVTTMTSTMTKIYEKPVEFFAEAEVEKVSYLIIFPSGAQTAEEGEDNMKSRMIRAFTLAVERRGRVRELLMGVRYVRYVRAYVEWDNKYLHEFKKLDNHVVAYMPKEERIWALTSIPIMMEEDEKTKFSEVTLHNTLAGYLKKKEKGATPVGTWLFSYNAEKSGLAVVGGNKEKGKEKKKVSKMIKMTVVGKEAVKFWVEGGDFLVKKGK